MPKKLLTLILLDSPIEKDYTWEVELHCSTSYPGALFFIITVEIFFQNLLVISPMIFLKYLCIGPSFK